MKHDHLISRGFVLRILLKAGVLFVALNLLFAWANPLPLLGRIPGLGYLFSYENRGRKKTNLFVFLRPYVVREEGKSSALALDRYAYIRGQVSANSIADNFLFRGFQGTQLPETLPVPPAMRRHERPRSVERKGWRNDPE